MSRWLQKMRAFVIPIKNLPRLLREVWQTDRRLCAIMLILRVSGAILPVGTLAIGGMLVDAINHSQQSHQGLRRVWILCVIEGIAALSAACIVRIEEHNDLELGNRFTLRLNLQLMAHCAGITLERFEDAHFQDTLERARRQIASQIAILTAVMQVVQQVIGIISVFIGAAIVAPGLIAVQVLGVFPLVIIESYFVRLRYAVSRQRTPMLRLLSYYLSLVTGISAVKEMKLFSISQFIINEYQTISTHHIREDSHISHKQTQAGVVLCILATGVYYSTYCLLISRTLAGIMTLGRVLFLCGLLQRFRGLLALLFSNVAQGIGQLMYVGDVFDLLDQEGTDDSQRPTIQRAMPAMKAPHIEFRGVSFSYSGSSKRVLRNVSFDVRPGETIALVGHNGAGKSTLLKLLARLYEPTEGSIFFDGVDIREYSPAQVRSITTAVFQDYVRYDLTASLNIGFGDIENVDDVASIANAADAASVGNIIRNFPNKFEQILGRRFKNGIELSGGQWQRLALARAYMRNAKIIILDEPTASVDARVEHLLQADAPRPVEGKVTIVVSHRFSTVRLADRILVLKEGNVCEQGTHTELLALNGEYATLFELQARGYR